MKKEICLSCLTVCTIMLACSTPSDKSVRSAASVIPVDLEHAGALQASQWFDTIMYVPLETSDSFLFSNISHLKVSRDQNIYFISDKSFFLFDGHTEKGKLKISRLGTGPDGYASLFDSYIDPETQEIELLDNNGKKIVVYDKKGNHLRSFAIPFMSFTLTKTDQHNYWFYNNNLPSEACNYKVTHYNRITEKSEEAYDSIDPSNLFISVRISEQCAAMPIRCLLL